MKLRALPFRFFVSATAQTVCKTCAQTKIVCQLLSLLTANCTMSKITKKICMLQTFLTGYCPVPSQLTPDHDLIFHDIAAKCEGGKVNLLAEW